MSYDTWKTTPPADGDRWDTRPDDEARLEYLAAQAQYERDLDAQRELVLSSYLRVLRDDGGWSSAKIAQTVAAILDRDEAERRR